jgi:ketosteroid isomerase-like protein
MAEGRKLLSTNLDLVRSIYATWERGDYSVAEWAHPRIEYVIADGPAPGTSTGLTGMADRLRDFLSAWEGVRLVAEEYRELDGERILALHRLTGRGKTSGLQIGQLRGEGAYLFNIRDGAVTRLVAYIDRDRALADLALDTDGDTS